MKKKLVTVVLSVAMIMSAATCFAFADTDDCQSKINSVDQLKMQIKDSLSDGKMTDKEKEVLTEKTADKVMYEFMEEKMDKAVSVINDNKEKLQMPLGQNFAVYHYSLGDGSALVVELNDVAENIQVLSTSGSNNVWKEYGNRYFTATATVDCAVGTATLILENHYVLSSNGIDENYGLAKSISSSSSNIIDRGNPVITDSAARTPGGSDVNMYCKYTLKERKASGTGTIKSEYRMNTTVKYLAIDKTNKKIKVGHAWNLTKL